MALRRVVHFLRHSADSVSQKNATATGVYPPSLRSPWRAASEGSIKITTARFQQLLEAAQIVSAGALKVTAKSALENHGLLLGQNVTLSASRGGLTELDRQRGRVSRLSRHEVIQNNAGARIVGREGIYLISARVQNFGDLLAQTKECLITVDMSFRNQGRAYAGGKLIVQARTTHNQGCLASSEEIRLSVKQGLKNQNGVITAQNFGFLSVNADGTLLDTQLKLLAEVASGRLVDPKPVTIDAASIENVGMISGSCVTVRSVLGNQQHPQGWIENQANAKIVGTALLNLAAATVHNAGKLIGDQQIKLTADQVHNSGAIAPQTEKNSKLKLEIVASKKVENTGFIKAALLEISTALWVNTGNVNVAKLQVKSYQGVDNTFENTGEVQANVQIDLEMSSLTNQALMETQGNLVAKQSVLNIVQKPKARLISSQNLTLDVAQEIQNAGLISGKKVSLSTVDLKGSIEQLETARVLSEQEMVWQSAKIHHAGEAIVQSGPFTAGGRIFEQLETGQVLAAGRLSVRVEAMTNKGLLASGKKIKMVAEKIVNQGTLSAESDISLLAKDKAQGPLGEIPDQLLKDIQQGKWLKPLPVQLQAEKHIQNEGYISGSQVKLFARTPDKPLERVSNAAKARIQGKEAIELFSVTIDNSGDIVGQESCVIAGGKTPTGETLAAKELDNRGIIAGQAIILHADKIHNKTTGKMNATQSLRCAAVDLENQKECTTKVLELTIEKQLTNEADAQIQCHSGKITAEKIIQQGQLSATEKLVVTATEFRHTQGEVSAPELVINSTDIHLNAPVKGKRIEIRGKNIHITQPIEAEGDIEIFHEGGEWNIASDMLRTKGKVIIHLKDGRVVEPLKVQGSLHYKVDDQAKKPLSFLGDHFVPGELSIQTPTDVMISNKEHYVKLGADDKQNCERISIEARNIELLNGRLVSGQRLKLKAQSAIQLGCRSGPLGLRSALASGDIELDAGSIAWNQIELRGENLTVKAINLDDISSEVFIEQDAQFEVLNSEHRLLVEVVNHGGKQVPFNNNFGHAREKRLYHEQRTLSPPAYLQVGGRLKLGGRTRLFGSMLYCGSFDPSSTLPLQENFIPYLEWVESFLCGHRKVEKAWWVHCWHRETGVPALAAFSEGTGLQMRVPRLAIAGILTSPRIALYNVEAGMVGLPLELHVSVPAPKPFQSRLVLSDYVQSTSLFRISRPASYATVYQPVLPQFAFSLEPIVVAGTNGSLRPNVHHHRCLLTHAQEMAFITKACFKATGQGFLFPGLTPFELLMISKENAKSCLDRAKEGAAFIPVGAALQDPFMVYEEQSLIHGSTEEEWVLKPVFYLPKRFDNPRIRAGALGMFALGDVLIEGASLASSRLLITGDIYGGGSVHIRQFQEVIQARRFSRQKQCVTDTVTESRYFGAKKKTQHTQQEIEVVRSELPSCITGDSIVIEKIARLQQSGGELYAGPGGTQVNVEYLIHLPAITIEVAVRSSKFPGQKSLTHEPKMIPIPNIIHSVGPVEIKVLKAHLYLQVNGQRQTPTQCIIEAEDLSFEQIEEVLRAAEAYRESVERDAARTAKRKQTQGVVKVIAAAALSAVVGPQIGAALKGISFFAENALALSCVKGMTMGFMNSIIAGQNPVKGALTGAAFDMFACKVGEYLGGIDALQGAEKLQEGLANLATTAVATAVQGGDVVQSLAVSLAADQIATRVLPSTLEPSAMQQITQSIARSTAVACLRGVETAK